MPKTENWTKRSGGDVGTVAEKGRARRVTSAIMAVSQPYTSSEIFFTSPDDGRALLDQTIGIGKALGVIDISQTIARNVGPKSIAELFESERFTVEMKNGSSILFVRQKLEVC